MKTIAALKIKLLKMNSKNKIHLNCNETGESLNNLKEVILTHWEDLVREVISSSKHEPSIILMDHIPGILQQLISILKKGEVQEIEFGKSHGFHRAILTQYSVADLLTEYSLLRETLMDFLYPMGDVGCAKLVHKYLDILSKHSVIEFTNDQIMKNTFDRQPLGNEVHEIKSNPVIETHD